MELLALVGVLLLVYVSFAVSARASSTRRCPLLVVFVVHAQLDACTLMLRFSYP